MEVSKENTIQILTRIGKMRFLKFLFELFNSIQSIFTNRILTSSMIISRRDSFNFLQKLTPLEIPYQLIRVGSPNDGGYIIPNDLEGISAIFSPGVDQNSSFELFFADSGVPCYLLDGSVDEPAAKSNLISFQKKYLGPFTYGNFISLEDWVHDSKLDPDFILQMDIEGGEYEIIRNLGHDILLKFRIIVVEFHSIDKIFDLNDSLGIRISMLNLLEHFDLVHVHPNNCCGVRKINGITIPVVAEFTFIRKDRTNSTRTSSSLPNVLDMPNLSWKKDLVFKGSWYQ